MGESDVSDRLHVLELLPCRLLGFVEAGVVDRDRCPVRDELHQLEVDVGEGARNEGADVEDAEHPAVEQERHAEHRLDALLAQDRIEDVGVVDVVEHHGLAVGGDPAGEAAPDRDAHALLDLLLDPDRRARHQLLGLLVVEQHGARVDLEDVASPDEERGQQLFELQVAQGDVGQRLQPAQLFDVLDRIGHSKDILPLSRRNSPPLDRRTYVRVEQTFP